MLIKLTFTTSYRHHRVETGQMSAERQERPSCLYEAAVNGSERNQKRTRTAYSSYQLVELEKEYQINRYLCKGRREHIALHLHLNDRQIKIWFQNRRMRDKKENKTEKGGRGGAPSPFSIPTSLNPSPTDVLAPPMPSSSDIPRYTPQLAGFNDTSPTPVCCIQQPYQNPNYTRTCMHLPQSCHIERQNTKRSVCRNEEYQQHQNVASIEYPQCSYWNASRANSLQNSQQPTSNSQFYNSPEFRYSQEYALRYAFSMARSFNSNQSVSAGQQMPSTKPYLFNPLNSNEVYHPLNSNEVYHPLNSNEVYHPLNSNEVASRMENSTKGEDGKYGGPDWLKEMSVRQTLHPANDQLPPPLSHMGI